MNSTFKSFPPGWNNILVPTHRKGATLAGIAMYGPTAPRGIWAQRAAWALVSMGGPRLLPGNRAAWSPPLPPDEWTTLLDALQAVAGRFDGYAVYERRDKRQGLLMLLLDGDRSVGFVKARRGDTAGIRREEAALHLTERAGVRAFATPRVLGSGAVDDWVYLATSPLPPRMHRMLPTMPSPTVLDEIAIALADLERPEGTPSDWVPFHGDFTPWNLRRIGRGTPWLIDWEEAGWAPPDADRVFYVASAYAVGRPVTDGRLPASAAVNYWREEVSRRTHEKLADGVELRPIDYGMIDALDVGKGA